MRNSVLYVKLWEYGAKQTITYRREGEPVTLRMAYRKDFDGDGAAGVFMAYDEPSLRDSPWPCVWIYRAKLPPWSLEAREAPDPDAANEHELFTLAHELGHFESWRESFEAKDGRWDRYFEAAYKRDGILRSKDGDPNCEEYAGQCLTPAECERIREEELAATERAQELLESFEFDEPSYVAERGRVNMERHELNLETASTAKQTATKMS